MKLALARINYSQLYFVYDEGRTYEQRDILIPYHLLVLATRAEREGIDVRIFDAEVGLLNEEQLAYNILEWGPDFVGLTATTPDITGTLKVCEMLKIRKPSIKTIIGGSHVTAIPDIQSLYVDFIVKGYGEKAIVEIIKENCHSGVVEIMPDHFQGSPAYHLLDYSDYQFTDPLRGRMNATSIMSAQGCPFDCVFCFHDKNLRYKSVNDFICEIDYLYYQKDVRYFFIYDETFLLNKKRTFEILRKLKMYKRAHFQCQTRANLVDQKIVDKMKESNFVRVTMGLESGSDEILKRASKGVTKEDAVKACQLLHDAGIETRASFILGLPYETSKTVDETIEFAKKLDLYHANFNIMTPYPGSKTYEMACNGEGLHFKEERYKTGWDKYRRWGKSVIRTDALTADDLEGYQIKAQVEFYARPKMLEYYQHLFENGNRSRYFYRPLNFAWQKKFNECIPFWNELDETEMLNPGRKK